MKDMNKDRNKQHKRKVLGMRGGVGRYLGLELQALVASSLVSWKLDELQKD